MGEVFRARDSRLDRQVAIKLLPAALSDDGERLRRFEHEARAAAALAHPNVLAVHDVGKHEGAPYLVCELVEGETLRQKIAAGPLPVRRAIDVAVQVARGLAAAHEAGIVHRDLKPENVMVGRDGRVRILDFGLAKLSGSGLGATGGSTAATVADATEPGVVLGTFGYMSPEQARGEPADGRSDLFALGGILFEMVTGRRAFQGSSPIEILHAILRDEAPDLVQSPALGRVVSRCLAKDPRDRFQSARDLAFHLESLAGSTSGASGLAPLPARPRGRLNAGVAAAALAILAAGLAAGLLFPREAPPPARVRYLTSSGHDAKPAVSPDGRSIAFVSVRDGTSRIWLADLVTRDEAALTAGPDDQLPRFSPDGSAVLFTRLENGRASIFRVGVLGGEPRRIASDADDGDWSPDGGSVVFVRTRPDADAQIVQLVTARVDGSDERVLATTSDAAFLFPRFSPDGRAVAVVRSRRGNIALGDEIVLVDLAGEVRTLLAAEPGVVAGSAAWTAAGELLAVTGALPAVGGTGRLLRIDPRSGRRQVLLEDPDGIAAVDVASAGAVVFESGESGGSLVEIGPGGLRVLAAGHATERQPAVDPRGEWVAYSSNRAGNLDVWALSARTGEVRRLTDHPAEDWDPAWLPDGRLLWSSGRSGAFEIWTADSDGSAPRPLSRDGVDAENPSASPDGAWVVYSSTNPAGTGIWKIKSDGTEPTLLVESPRAIIPEVSPDGRHVLYLDAWGGGATTTVLRVVELADGAPVPFEIRVPGGTAAGDQSARVFFGRARWLGDGDRIAFIGSDGGRATIFAQDFRPGEDTTATRRRLVELPADLVPESFAVAPDGRLVVAAYRPTSYLLLAEGLGGVERPRRGAPERGL